MIIKDENTRAKVQFTLESSAGAEVEEVTTLALASALIPGDDPPAWDAIVYDEASGSLKDLEPFRLKTSKIPCYYCTDVMEQQMLPTLSITQLIPKSTLLTTLLPLVQSSKSEAPENPDDFCKIRTTILLSVYPLKGDLYIKLSDIKYVLLFKEGDAFETSDLVKYTQQKGVQFLYIKKAQCGEFIDKYRLELEKTLMQTPIPFAEATAKSTDALETVRELGARMGFTKEVQSLAKTQVQMAVKVLGKSPRLADILAKMQASPERYIASHSMMCGYFACAIATQMEWGSEMTFHKLSLAAFLHDITLENQLLAQCDNPDEAKEKGFSAQEIQTFKLHPVRAAEIAKGFHEVPPDVDQIIAQHHEKPDGSGWPRQMTHTYMAPLATLFVVAHEMAKQACLNPKTFDPKKFVIEVQGKYKSSQFRKVIQAVERSFGAGDAPPAPGMPPTDTPEGEG